MAKILEVKYENQADARVCEVAYESQADLCWHEVGYATQATGDALWFFVNYENQASFKIFKVKRESQADLRIFKVAHAEQAGWRTRSRASWPDDAEHASSSHQALRPCGCRLHGCTPRQPPPPSQVPL